MIVKCNNTRCEQSVQGSCLPKASDGEVVLLLIEAYWEGSPCGTRLYCESFKGKEKTNDTE